ncbi:sensor domain-containing protein [Alkalimonas amylolytica]|uniref:PAS domain S-box-containing protein/diguanylate cyclase (GGDEF) domain-containing protein n=1 Tax=Alkalimonas amylolytica TaxID=152573 RepID=A0A1H4CHQ4_ALKAM|nr:sensor domain-containing diguanylate cyclase [Alkalimonas amylolytica]SEA59951.1 PAS domain S-box-containing protein/diguanylate cyclase (GGDEF) domain-containing protein [Alkalimonas amylolytica]
MNPIPHIPNDKLLDLLLDVVCVVDKEGRFLSVSAASERVFGYRPEEMIGRTAFEFIHPDDQNTTRSVVERINSGLADADHENRYIHKNGQVVHIMWATQWLETEQVRIGVARDITARKRAESMQAAMYAISAAAHLTSDLQVLFQQVHELIKPFLPAENFFVALYDAQQEQLSFPYFVNRDDAPSSARSLQTDTLIAEVMHTGEVLLLTQDTARQRLSKIGAAEQHPLNWLGVPLITGSDTIGILVVQNDTCAATYTEQDKELLLFVANQLVAAMEHQRTNSRLEYLAQYDQLTELPNRALFLDRLQNTLKRAQRNTSRLAVLYLDLDKFKQINDTFGHTTGDYLLQDVAQRLQQCVRDCDTVGRLGGDEFAILLDDIHEPDDAVVVAEKIIAHLSNPFVLKEVTVITTPSLGIAIYPEHGQDYLQLIKHADEAMYTAKRNGGQCYNLIPAKDTPPA